jgi:hypothetical protein
MISDTCGGKTKGKSSDMGGGSMGSGNNPAGTGTQPPQ